MATKNSSSENDDGRSNDSDTSSVDSTTRGRPSIELAFPRELTDGKSLLQSDRWGDWDGGQLGGRPVSSKSRCKNISSWFAGYCTNIYV